jgi:Putative Actinobacterial Holin-X, holin superfamily III
VTSDPSTPVLRPGAASTADLVRQATSQISTLVRDELALARIELVAKGKRAALGGGLLAGAATFALYGIGLAIVLAVVGLDLVWPLWLAIAVVAAVVFAAAGIAALVGKRQLAAAAPLIPKQAISGIAADLETVKDAIRDGRPA